MCFPYQGFNQLLYLKLIPRTNSRPHDEPAKYECTCMTEDAHTFCVTDEGLGGNPSVKRRKIIRKNILFQLSDVKYRAFQSKLKMTQISVFIATQLQFHQIKSKQG